MKVEVEVTSTEFIKPSSPTPNHLRHYKFSFIDQTSPPTYFPLILFYDVSENKLGQNDISNNLKKSLSEVLTHYYPLAGRIRENFYVDCNDEGVRFLQAQAKCQLSQIIQESHTNEFNKFVPNELDAYNCLPLAIQVNFFDCGSVAIVVLISHKIADGSSLVKFVQNWGAIARGRDIVSPQFLSATLFPPKKSISEIHTNTSMPNENIVLKRFVFNASMIDALREKYANKTSLENARRPTRVETVSAFIWGRFATAAQIYSGPKRLYAVLHSVNLRKRMVPPLPDHSFGNIWQLAVSLPSQDVQKDWYGFVSQFRVAISSINEDHVKYLQDHGNRHLNFIQGGATEGEVVVFHFTSWCNFPIYEADFGWGKPLWVGWANLSFKNVIVFMDTKCGDGIEAWVQLKEDDMARFENDQDVAYATTPCPCP